MATSYLYDENGDPFNSATFDWQQYLADRVPDPRLLEHPEGRRALTRVDPMLFALIYCRDLLKNKEGKVTFGDLHLELCRQALTWIRPPAGKEHRHAYIAPRGAGKSTFGFKILPLWAAAHGHVKFIAAFSASATQAEGHLTGLRRLIEANPLIEEDYEDLAEPARRPNGNTVADNQHTTYRKNGFSFTARGIDSSVLGLVNDQNLRPELLLLDDIEPDESNYSLDQKYKRLTTITDTIFPMNPSAHVLLIGTVTMPDSIVHDLTKSVTSDEPVPRWIVEERFQAHYIAPIVQNPDGTERSFWEGKFPFDLGSPEKGGFKYERNTRSFKKNMENMPVGDDGFLWGPEDFLYGTVEPKRVLLQIDPAVTSKSTSDFTAFAVIAYQPAKRGKNGSKDTLDVCEVRHIEAVKLSPSSLREKALRIISAYPEIGAIRIESNQGGDTWKSIFHDMPVQVVVHRESVNKKIRAQHLHNHYQRKRVLHAQPFPKLESQMMSFPNVLNDDMIDAVGSGVQYFFRPKHKFRAGSFDYRVGG